MGTPTVEEGRGLYAGLNLLKDVADKLTDKPDDQDKFP